MTFATVATLTALAAEPNHPSSDPLAPLVGAIVLEVAYVAYRATWPCRTREAWLSANTGINNKVLWEHVIEDASYLISASDRDQMASVARHLHEVDRLDEEDFGRNWAADRALTKGGS